MEKKAEGQQSPVNDKDVAVIKAVFKNNEALLKSIRALFFNMEITKEEKDLIQSTFKGSEILKIFHNRFYPQINRDSPIGQVQDVWLGVEQMVFGFPKDTIYQAVHYKEKALGMTKVALQLLENPDGLKVDVSYDSRQSLVDDLGVNLLARNQYLRHIEGQLLYIKMIADTEEKTPAEIKKIQLQNSVK